MERTGKIRAIGIIITIVIAIFFIETIIFRTEIENFLAGGTKAYGAIAIFTGSFLLDMLPQYLSPHIFFLQFGIINFPLSLLIVSVILGSSLGSILGFETGKKFGPKLVNSAYDKKKSERIRKKIHHHGKWFMALAAISPLPYIPLIFGALGINRREFFFFGLIPRIIGLTIFGLFFI